MRIKFLHSIAGGLNFNAGDIADIPDAEAKRLVDGKIAIAEPARQRTTSLDASLNRATLEQAKAKP